MRPTLPRPSANIRAAAQHSHRFTLISLFRARLLDPKKRGDAGMVTPMSGPVSISLVAPAVPVFRPLLQLPSPPNRVRTASKNAAFCHGVADIGLTGGGDASNGERNPELTPTYFQTIVIIFCSRLALCGAPSPVNNVHAFFCMFSRAARHW